MAYVARRDEFHAAQPVRPRLAAQSVPNRPGFWRRVFDAIMLSHQRDAQREVERYVARRGKLTDSMEREIADRLTRIQ